MPTKRNKNAQKQRAVTVLSWVLTAAVAIGVGSCAIYHKKDQPLAATQTPPSQTDRKSPSVAATPKNDAAVAKASAVPQQPAPATPPKAPAPAPQPSDGWTVFVPEANQSTAA